MLDDKIFCQFREAFHEALAESHEANVRLLVALLAQSEALLVASDEHSFISTYEPPHEHSFVQPNEHSKPRKTRSLPPA